MRMLKWLLKRLEGPRAGLWVILTALVLALPTLFASLFVDEYMQANRWKEGVGRFLNRCFVFADGSLVDVQRELHDKLGIWWAAQDFKVAFWRPLTAASLALDHWLWPRSSALMHLHSLLWFVALLFAVRALYERMHTPRVAALALALYAWDDARGPVLSWVAKRNVLVAGFFGVCALIAYDKWRRDGWKPGAWLGPVLFASALLSAEAALATTGFLFGYALLLDKGSLTRRLTRLLPYLLVVVLWQVAYATGGYGAKAPGFHYVHPLTQPLEYAAQVAEVAPLLILGQLTPLLSDAGGAFQGVVKLVLYLVAVLLPVVLVWRGRPLLKGAPQAGVWVLGAGLSLLPVCASAPTDTNLVFIGLGVSPALALLLDRVLDQPLTSRWLRYLLSTLVVFNLFLAPLQLPLKCLFTRGMEYLGVKADATLPRDPSVADKTLVVAAIPFDGVLPFVLSRRDFEHIPRPAKTRLLAVSAGEVSVTRTDEVTLRVRPAGGFFANDLQRMYTDRSKPFRSGDVVTLPDLSATILELTSDGRPQTVEYRLAEPLESPRWLWMRGQGFGFVDWTPPKVGETVVVPGSSSSR